MTIALAGIGVLSLLGVILSLAIPDSDVPSQANYERCLDQAAEKAFGNIGVFNVLRWERCDKLEPTKPKSVSFDDLIPGANLPPQKDQTKN